MTFREVLNGWESLSTVGRFSFLLRSSFGRGEESTEEALGRYGFAKFEDLPWQLQDEFQVYVETDFYRKHFRPKGGESDGGKIGDGG